MLGDYMIFITKFMKQFACLHDYELTSNTNGQWHIYECERCGRTKVKR